MPDGAADLVADLYRRMPDARITDILLELQRRSGPQFHDWSVEELL